MNIAKEISRLVAENKVFTDIRIEQDQPFVWHVPGGWEPTGVGRVTREDIKEFLQGIDPQWEAQIKGRALERTLSTTSCRLRCNVYTTHRASKINLVIRKHPMKPATPAELGIPNALTEMIGYAKGLVIVTGPTGAGKTTTIASMLQHLNSLRPMHIVTVEDPIEFQLKPDKAVISQKEVPHDVPTFAEGLRESLRQKPNVIMIGEVRDKDTAETMFYAAESGHLVIGSMHTNSAEGALSKILSFFPGEHEARMHGLSLNLLAVLCQVLVPSKDRKRFSMASEVLFNSPKIAKAIQEGRFSDIRQIMEDGSDGINRHLNSALAAMVADNVISSQDAIRATYNSQGLETLIGDVL